MQESTISESRLTYFNHDNFVIRIQYNCSELLIEIRNRLNSTFYSKKYTPSDVEELDAIFGPQLEDLHENLLLAFNGADKSLVASIDPQPTIKLKWSGKFGNANRTVYLNIELQELKLQPLEKCQKLLAEVQEQESQTYSYGESQFIRIFGDLFEHMSTKDNKPLEKQENVDMSAANSALESLTGRIKRIEENYRPSTNTEIIIKRIEALEITQKKLEDVQELKEALAKANEKISELEKARNHENIEKENLGTLLGHLTGKISVLEAKYTEVEAMTSKLDELKQSLESTDERMRQIMDNRLENFTKVLEGVTKQLTELRALCKSSTEKAKSYEKEMEKLAKLTDDYKECLRKIAKLEEDIKIPRGPAINSIEDLKNKLDTFENKYKSIDDNLELIREHQKANTTDLLALTTEQATELTVLKKRFENIEGQIESFKKDTERLNSIDRRMVSLENQKSFVPIFPHFRPEYPDDIQYKNYNKVIESKEGILVNQSLFCQKPLPKTGKSCFSLKINQFGIQDGSFLAIGVAVEKFKDTGIIVSPGCYFINPFDKLAYLNGRIVEYGADHVKADDVINVLIDRDNGCICFKINDTLYADEIIDAASFEDADLYPCVFIENCKDFKLSFI